ncbi:MAG: hypothetical protein JWP34_4521 [Massilia sp.]|nr:hypothetical protein [Massilia sp.]
MRDTMLRARIGPIISGTHYLLLSAVSGIPPGQPPCPAHIRFPMTNILQAYHRATNPQLSPHTDSLGEACGCSMRCNTRQVLERARR